MKGIRILYIFLVLTGCASKTVYEEVSNDLVNSNSHFLHYETSWVRAKPFSTNITTYDENQVITDDLNSCVTALEAELREFAGKNEPNKSLATLQMSECLLEKGWKIEVIQAIILQD